MLTEAISADILVEEWFTRSEAGLTVKPGMQPTLEVFELTLRVLVQDLDTLRFQIGDLASEMVQRFGMAAYERLAASLFDERTARTVEDWTYVARNVPYLVRRPGELSFNHHRAVAPFSERSEIQTQWLQRAIDGGWSVSRLREEIRRVDSSKEPPTFDTDRAFELELLNAALHRRVDNEVREREVLAGRLSVLEKRTETIQSAVGQLREMLRMRPAELVQDPGGLVKSLKAILVALEQALR